MKLLAAITSIADLPTGQLEFRANSAPSNMPNHDLAVVSEVLLGNAAGSLVHVGLTEVVNDSIFISFCVSVSSTSRPEFLRLGNDLLKCNFEGSSSSRTLIFQQWVDGSWETLIQTDYPNSYSIIRMDLAIKLGTDGFVKLYFNQSLVSEYAGPVIDGEISHIEISSPSTSTNTTRLAALFVTDEPTIDKMFVQRTPTSQGTHTDWEGDHTNVNGVGLGGSDGIMSSLVGDKESFLSNVNLSDFAGQRVYGLAISTVAQAGSEVEGGIAGLVRVGGVDVVSDGQDLSQELKTPKFFIDGEWSVEDIIGSEFGVVAT